MTAEDITTLWSNPDLPVFMGVSVDDEVIVDRATSVKLLEYIETDQRFHFKKDYDNLEKPDDITDDHISLLEEVYTESYIEEWGAEEIIENFNELKWAKGVFIT